MTRIWLKETPSDSPAPRQFVVVRKGGEVLTGTAADIAEDVFNASYYGQPDHDVAEVWAWTDAGPIRMKLLQAFGDAVLTLDLVDPSGTVVATATA